VDDRPTPEPQPVDRPTAIRWAGLLALLAVFVLDAHSSTWNPEPWTYVLGIAALVLGPAVLNKR
jgi:hypothetical protein